MFTRSGFEPRSTEGARRAKPRTPSAERERRRRWLAVGLALAIGLAVEVRHRQASALRDGWGSRADVVAATDDLPAGHRLVAGDVVVVAAPAHLVPATAIDPADAVVGTVVVRSVAAGALLTSHDLGGAAAPDPDEVWLSIPVDPRATPALVAGDRVDIHAVDPFEGHVAPAADGARVVEVSADADELTVAVARDQVPALAAASVTSGLVVSLRSRG